MLAFENLKKETLSLEGVERACQSGFTRCNEIFEKLNSLTFTTSQTLEKPDEITSLIDKYTETCESLDKKEKELEEEKNHKLKKIKTLKEKLGELCKEEGKTEEISELTTIINNFQEETETLSGKASNLSREKELAINFKKEITKEIKERVGNLEGEVQKLS
jgi:chromosome segregation ATPase